MAEYRVGAIMRTDFPTLTAQTPIRSAVAALVDSNSTSAPVLSDNGNLIGILTQKDCFRPALHASYHREWTGQVGDFMTPEVITVDFEDELIQVAEMFVEYSHRVFPVLQDTSFAGLLHRSDVLAKLTRLA